MSRNPRSFLAAVARMFATGIAVWMTMACAVAQPTDAAPERLEIGRAVPGSSTGTQSAAQAGDKLPRLVGELSETVERVPVKLRLAGGRRITGDMVITHFKPAGAGPFPAVIINHGRSGSKRHTPPRARMLPLVRFWTRRGFAVIVPTRVGYGALGQAVDPELAGRCSTADFRPVIEAMAVQGAEAARFAARLPHVDGGRLLMTGISYGGIGALGAAAKSVPGVIGAINFVGGVGGNPDKRPGEPCRGELMVKLLGVLGSKSRVPTLWLYSQNDRFWGQDWPRRWHGAYAGAGGMAEMVSFPPVGTDGHKLTSRGFRVWRPVVDKFIRQVGFKVPEAAPRLPASGFARVDEADRVPHINDAGRSNGYGRFLKADVPRAFALAPSGAWSWRRGSDAAEIALRSCQKRAKTKCRLYAVDDRVVWTSDNRDQR